MNIEEKKELNEAWAGILIDWAISIGLALVMTACLLAGG
jgi:hypothetical protein